MSKYDRYAMIEALKPEIEAFFGPCDVEPMYLGMKYSVRTRSEVDEVLRVPVNLGNIVMFGVAKNGDCMYLMECPDHILADWTE